MSRSQAQSSNNSQAASQAEPIDGILCQSMEGSAYHVHTHVDMFVDGQQVPLDAKIGVLGLCMYWTHTHDTSGIIHVESPELDKHFTLGNFFNIWGKKLSLEEFLDKKIDATHPLKVYVNGEEYKGNPRDIVLDAHKQITIVYGQPPANIPNSFNFPQGL